MSGFALKLLETEKCSIISEESKLIGIIKNILGIRTFMLRELKKVSTEFELVKSAYNIKRLFNKELSVVDLGNKDLVLDIKFSPFFNPYIEL